MRYIFTYKRAGLTHPVSHINRNSPADRVDSEGGEKGGLWEQDLGKSELSKERGAQAGSEERRRQQRR